MKIRRGTKRFYLHEMFSVGSTSREAYADLSPKVRDQVPPWIFTANLPGGRRPKPIAEQLVDLQNEINRAFNLFGRMERDGETPEFHGPETPEIPESETPEPESETPDPEPEPEKPRAKGKSGIDGQKQRFYDEWNRLRTWIKETSERTGAIPLDSLDSNRPVEDAIPLLENGISADTLVGSMTLHWPKASKEMAGITEPDFTAQCEPMGDEFHRLAGYVLKLAEARRNIMLIGPSGTGKSFLAKQLASMIQTEAHPNGLPYGETPMTPGATRGDLLGRHTIGGLDKVIAAAALNDVQTLQSVLDGGGSGFVLSQFVEIYSGGGVFNFEEMDAADASMLIVVNNALASDQLFNSANGEVYDKHPDFIAIATANTFGLGADSHFTGRTKLDLATIDRFRMGRVIMYLDENLVYRMMFPNG